MARIGGDLLKCSFCGKSQKQVKKLIAGPGVYICDECVDQCEEIIEEELAEAAELTHVRSASSGPAGPLTPAEREERWTLWVWLAIKAASNVEADDVVGQALAGLEREMPLRGEPVLHPRDRHHPDDIWVAELGPDLSFYEAIDPDDAKTRCSLVLTYFPGEGVIWSHPVNTEREARCEWPTDIWNRRPGMDPGVLLHPAVQAVRIFCAAKQG